MRAVATVNPMTYILEGLRSLVSNDITGGTPGPVWNVTELGEALVAVAAFGAVSLSLALLALRGRVRRR